MKKVLYTKYNSLRKPEFQIKTNILSDGDNQYVIKQAMNDKAKLKLQSMKENHKLLSDAYKNIKVIPYIETEDGLKFDFIKGKPLLDGVDFAHESIDDIVDKVKKALDIVLDIDDKYIEDFKMTDKFSRLFPDCNPEGEKSYRVANIDSIFSNFVNVDGEIWCIDYEWVLDFDVPVGYVVYRSLLSLYKDKGRVLEGRISFEDFCTKVSLPLDRLPMYQNMEKCFNDYIYGYELKYIYVNNYIKKSTTFEELNKELLSKNQKINDLEADMQEKEQHIKNLEAENNGQALYIKKVKKAIKNPLYGVGAVVKKTYNKLRGSK